MDLALPTDIAKKTNSALRIIEWLDGRYVNWGRPDFDIKSDVFWEMIFDIIKVWERAWPQEKSDWEHDRKIDLRDEKSLAQLVKIGLKKSVAYPPHLFQLFKAYWPHGSFSNREFTQQFMGRFPIFRNSNYT